jgi:hypothetical protein
MPRTLGHEHFSRIAMAIDNRGGKLRTCPGRFRTDTTRNWIDDEGDRKQKALL